MFTIVCDFEGTVTTTDVTQQLLEAFALPEWRTIEQDWLEGRISARRCLAIQASMIRATRATLLRFFYRVEIDPTFVKFAEFCTTQKIPLFIVSEGFDLAVRHILSRCGLGYLPFVANNLQQSGYDRWSLGLCRAADTCRTKTKICRCRMLADANDEVLLIGNGRSASCVAQLTDVVLAKEDLADYCVTQRIPHLLIDSFADTLFIVHQLLTPPRRHPAVSH